MNQTTKTTEQLAKAIAAAFADFYAASQLTLPTFQILTAADLPQPYRDLLVHNSDMTSTLETHHHQRVSLRVLKSRQSGSWLHRLVVLAGNDDGQAVECGAIRINLDCFDAEPRALILEGQRPLGAILESCQIHHTSCPSALFRVKADAVMTEALGPPSAEWLFGRQNELRSPQHQILAEVVEILPPS